MIPWVQKLPKDITRELLGSKDLAPHQIEQIGSIIEQESIDLKTLLFQVFHSRLVPLIVNQSWFILEGWLLQNEVPEEELQLLCQRITEAVDLTLVGVELDWINGNKDLAEHFYYRLRVLKILAQKYSRVELTVLLSYHINPYVPWSNSTNSELCSVKVITKFDEYYPSLKSNLLKQLPKRPLQGGLNPRLGYGGVKAEILQEDSLRNWKQHHVKALSMVYFCIVNYPDHWPIATSFMLNLFDDHEPEFKIQALHLLQLFLQHNGLVILKSGLKIQFVEAVKVCLSYIPNSTPVELSLRILSLAYPCMFQLLESASVKDSIEFLNSNILATISTLSNRYKHDYPILILSINQITIMANHLTTKILISFPRINFALSQLLTNAFIIDDDKYGTALYVACLQCQKTIIDHFLQLDDADGKQLMAEYKFDFIGAWTILAQRLQKNQVEDSPIFDQLKNNFKSLSSLTDIKPTLHKLYEESPDVKTSLINII